MNLYEQNDYCRVKNIDTTSKKCPDYRSPFRRDFSRLIHSPSFRRLQGKTQLFPGIESDFFRNRLTHSLEVAQIAKSITLYLNNSNAYLKDHRFLIDTDLVEFAGLAHDLGHPPFGHKGERALNKRMNECGGFEGNAQTFRILSRIEKKEKLDDDILGINSEGQDCRLGLNLTFRSLASIIKYDNVIPEKIDKQLKGLYYFDENILKDIKSHIVDGCCSEFRTIECYIMDIADDIAYSTYDLEDAFKAKFITPYSLITLDNELGLQILNKLKNKPDISISDIGDIRSVLYEIFGGIFYETVQKYHDHYSGYPKDTEEFMELFTNSYSASESLACDGYLRINFTSILIDNFISGVELIPNEKYPSLSVVKLKKEIKRQVEVLKEIAYVSLINSSFLKVSEHRGGEIIDAIFNRLSDDSKDGCLLLPKDYRKMYNKIEKCLKKRIICDFIAGMTDRYAIEFYGRLYSDHPETIFKPL